MASKSTNTDDYQKIFTDFWIVYEEQIKQNTKSLPFNFNILDAQCGTIKENSHTNILMKLLEYKNQYGYVFLKDFIEMADFEGDFGNLKYDENVAFETEYWDKVHGVEGRIDGLIYQREKFAIIIENKINGAPPQPNQLERYIKSVLGSGTKDSIVNSSDQVFVVLLTKDGVESPDDESIKYMCKNGILNQPESGSQSDSIAGPRYFACSYRHDILPWLENGVQPLVFYKESILSAGLVQYIDFLKGILGEREVKNAIWDNCKKWFDNNQTIQTALNGNLQEQNSFLYRFYIYLKDKNNNLNSNKSEEETKRTASCINLLQSLVCEKAEEPMAEFMKITKDFFTTGTDTKSVPLIEKDDYIVSHPLNFDYINIRSRDKKWPKGFMIGWFPTNFFGDVPKATLFFRIPNTYKILEIPDGFKLVQQKDCIVWRKEYNLPVVSQINKVDKDKLVELYNNSGIIKIIEEIKSAINT